MLEGRGTPRLSGIALIAAALQAVAACGGGAQPLRVEGGAESRAETSDGTSSHDGPAADVPAVVPIDAAVGDASHEDAAPDQGTSADMSRGDASPADVFDARAPSDAADGAEAGLPALPELLVRTWISNIDVGNCTNEHGWTTFGTDGTVVSRNIDENACTRKPRLVSKAEGTYTLTGRMLDLSLNGMGAGWHTLIMGIPKEPVAKRTERLPIVGAFVTPPWIGSGYLALDFLAYTSEDGQHFQSVRNARLDGTSGARIFEQNELVTVTVDRPLPLASGATCKVDVDYKLTLYDAATTPTSDDDTFHLSYMAVVRETEAGCLRLMPVPLDGLDNEKANVAWGSLLDAAGLNTNHSIRFANAFGLAFSYYLGHPTSDPLVLSQSLPQTARWLEATRPLPVQ